MLLDNSAPSSQSLPRASYAATDAVAGITAVGDKGGATQPSGHTPLTIEEIIQNVVEANSGAFPINAHLTDKDIQQNGGVLMEGESILSNTITDEGVAEAVTFPDTIDLSELSGSDSEGNVVLATLRSLVEAMSGTETGGGAPGEGMAKGAEHMEVWSREGKLAAHQHKWRRVCSAKSTVSSSSQHG